MIQLKQPHYSVASPTQCLEYFSELRIQFSSDACVL